MTTALAIKLPVIPQAVSIASEWLEKRDELLHAASEFKVIADDETLQRAAETAKSIGKASKQLEAMRLELSRPFSEAAATIKQTADKARQSLEDEKTRLTAMTTRYVEERRKQAEKAAREAEEARQREIEAQVQKQTEDEELGLPTAPVVVPDIAPVVAPPKVIGASFRENITFEIVDEDSVPRAFCMIDERKINAYARENKDAILNHVKGGNATGLVPGVKFIIKTTQY
jgi:hypothetical protein